MRHPEWPWIEFQQTPRGIDIVCTVCGLRPKCTLTPAAADQFARAHAEHVSAAQSHYGMGDLIARATKAVGISPCTPCEARRRALNQRFPRMWPR